MKKGSHNYASPPNVLLNTLLLAESLCLPRNSAAYENLRATWVQRRVKINIRHLAQMKMFLGRRTLPRPFIPGIYEYVLDEGKVKLEESGKGTIQWEP